MTSKLYSVLVVFLSDHERIWLFTVVLSKGVLCQEKVVKNFTRFTKIYKILLGKIGILQGKTGIKLGPTA